MATIGARHRRQTSLPEIGEQGQARLEASEVVLSGAGDAREVEATYLRLAGAKVREAYASASAKAKAKTKPDEKIAKDTLKALAIRDVAARDVAEGALRALLAMRAILGVGAEEDEHS